MEITVLERPGSEATIVALRDELDMSTAPRLHAVLGDLLGRSVNRIVVDLSGLTFCDSMGLSALAVTHNACVAAGGYLRMAGPSPFLLHILTVVGLRGRMPIYTSAQAACAADPASCCPTGCGCARRPEGRSRRTVVRSGARGPPPARSRAPQPASARRARPGRPRVAGPPTPARRCCRPRR